MAQNNNFISYVTKTNDLFQIPLSYVNQPGKKLFHFYCMYHLLNLSTYSI